MEKYIADEKSLQDCINIRQALFDNQDKEYKCFHSRLIPDIDKDKIIGVRLPVIRKIAKGAVKTKTDFDVYYYEEQMLKGLMIGLEKHNIDEYISLLDDFVPLIDNWAVCDCCSAGFKFTKKYKSQMLDYISKYLKSEREFELRFAIVMLMDYYIDDDYIDNTIDILSSIRSEYYYVNMAVAWALSVAYVSYPDKVLSILAGRTLSPFVQNKAISKICDSYRVSREDKQSIKQYRITKAQLS